MEKKKTGKRRREEEVECHLEKVARKSPSEKETLA